MNKIVITLGLALVLFTSCTEKKEVSTTTIEKKQTEEVASNTSTADPKTVTADPGTFQMKGLNYGYNDLDPYMDGATVETHYSKHHLGYCNKLNTAIKGTPMEKMSIEDILKNVDLKNGALRNNAGGYYNHNIFWEIIGPKAGGNPTGKIAELITRDFGSFDVFKTQFTDAGKNLFGSGWVWLISDASGKLKITTSVNQDNPLMPNAEVKGFPVMNLDVWEHAYYLKYKNERPKYIDSYWNLIDWNKVNERLATLN
ncbi:superoxide dismutase [Flavobacterium sp. xlx-214]|uniref:superoxide dismutase n=1 Tax=unclassified Flavobacterium TaxID=196869 RepID=UPI0013D767DE|nr:MULTISPECIES: superoxide dismutase [unclassified Flavobacterium]MBA5793231.1 superoxide dismutase [Flavobacterium sp. xlx-221]QMI82486.1 superoxide dismutase [Flavobacterium sp. xlx-214]